MKLLNERVAVITGSTKGNGRAIANIYSEQGSNVVVTGRDQVEAKNVADELSKEYGTDALGLKLDVTSVAEVEEMVDKILHKYGRIDVLVNNAGYPIKDDLWDVSFDQISDEVLERVLDVDTVGTYRCCREILPLMVERRRGVIINISSTPAISGYIKGAPYTVAKAANLGITKHIAAEFGKYGIRCNAIAPGTIATQRNWERLTTEQRVDIVSSIPLGRAGKPEEIAGVALMLASDYCSFVSGQTIVVDGGETIR
ncbi:MAG: dehydrogenase, short-chain alcohol dehydrogenase like [Nitrososphaera sp.]|nr:dehydrogenase, short-chain alcohol dehydrogenase like [Nitrososphaera sp.]